MVGAATMALEFKSGGNPDQCACGVMKFAASAMDAGTAPTKAAAAFDVVVQGMAVVPNRCMDTWFPWDVKNIACCREKLCTVIVVCMSDAQFP